MLAVSQQDPVLLDGTSAQDLSCLRRQNGDLFRTGIQASEKRVCVCVRVQWFGIKIIMLTHSLYNLIARGTFCISAHHVSTKYYLLVLCA